VATLVAYHEEGTAEAVPTNYKFMVDASLGCAPAFGTNDTIAWSVPLHGIVCHCLLCQQLARLPELSHADICFVNLKRVVGG
jgi:hypothetical protein